jgi:hypothetical protein
MHSGIAAITAARDSTSAFTHRLKPVTAVALALQAPGVDFVVALEELSHEARSSHLPFITV